jgi:hypothetical protein
MDELLARKTLSEGSQTGRVGADGRWSAQVRAHRDPAPSLNLTSHGNSRKLLWR